MADGADEDVTAESLGKLDGPQRFAGNGKKRLCAVPNCPKLSDGKRSNFMCRSHYTTTSLYRAEVEEEQRAREREAATSDGDGTVDGGDGDGEDEGVEVGGDGGGGGGRRSRRNRKPSAKILRSVESEQVMKKEVQRRREEKFGKGGSGDGSSKGTGGGGERTSARARATRIDYSALAGVNDDSSYASVVSYKKKTKVVADAQNEDDDYEEASSTAGSSVGAKAKAARPSIPKTRHVIRVAAYPPAPKSAKTSLGPEPSYLFRKGPLPPPSPPIGPQTDPPAFPFQRPIAVNPQEQHQSLADTGIYSNQIRRRVQAEANASDILPLPPRTVGGLRDQVERTKQCNCKKSGCLKLYCDVSIWIHSLRLICTFCRHASFSLSFNLPVAISTIVLSSLILIYSSFYLPLPSAPHDTTQCFANAIQCTDLCSCVKCHNNEDSVEHTRERSKIVVSVLERNPNAFRPKKQVGAAVHVAAAGAGSSGGVTTLAAPTRTESRGCNCKKSRCLKKYCECFNAAQYCSSETCKCRDCHNVKGNKDREAIMQSRLKRAEKDAKAAAASQATAQSGKNSSKDGKKGGGMPKGLMGDPVAAAALAAEAAAAGIDVFMPPSAFAVPMKVGLGGTEIPGLSFGTAGLKSKFRASATAHKRAYDTVEQSRKRKAQYPAEDLVRMETEYERDARLATIDLGSRLDTIYGLLELEKKTDTNESGAANESGEGHTGHIGIPSVISTEYLGLEGKRAKQSIEFVKGGASRIKEATDRAQQRARKLIEEKQSAVAAETSPETGTEDVAMMDEEDSSLGDLLCDETMPQAFSEPALQEGEKSTTAEDELFVLATQDAALLRELARIVREKALEMGAERIKQAASTAGRCHSAAEAIVKGGG